MIDVIIADDHKLVADGISRLIDGKENIKVVAVAHALKEAQELLSIHKPQVLLLDIAMPDGDGIDAIPLFTAASPHTRIIILTVYAERAVIKRAMDGGASGYILKSTSADEVIEGICEVARGNTFICRESQELFAGFKESAPSLTMREREILRLVVEGNTMKQIADKLNLGFETVHSYTKYLRQKLGCNNTASLVRRAIELHLV
ncbi:MAG: response regulator transcription factor [Prevotella sp.]|nr:response regulator transcription factor [Prevotella sp.]